MATPSRPSATSSQTDLAQYPTIAWGKRLAPLHSSQSSPCFGECVSASLPGTSRGYFNRYREQQSSDAAPDRFLTAGKCGAVRR